MARRYTRDARGRFSGGGGGGSRGGGSKPIQRGTNRLTRDNAGRITSQGGNGATARGGRLATASGNKRATQTAKLSGGGPKGTVGKPKGLKPGSIKAKPTAPAKGSLAANKMEMARGRSAVLGKQKDSLNKQLREVNAKIKEAGPAAGAYRLQKLQIQSRLSETRSSLGKSQTAAGSKATSKANAKQQAQVDGLKQKVARMRRAQSRFEATADTRNQPGSKMVRRPDAKTSRGNRRTEQARAIYMGASMQKMSNFAQGVARTSKARNNWMQPRSARVAQAKRAGLPLITVTGHRNRK